MKRNAMRKNLLQSIRKSFGRYIAIVAIIALGSSMFVGLLMTKTDMVATGQRYADQLNMFDLRLMSAYGWDLDQVSEIEQLGFAESVEPLIYQDLVVTMGESTDESVYRFLAIPDTINRIYLEGGRMPEAKNECLIDGYYLDDSIIGAQVTVSQNNAEDSLDAMEETTFTVVGRCASPLFMDMNRGTTSVGNGTLSSYVFVPRDVFDMDYCAEIHITMAENYELYSETYNDAMEALSDWLEPQLEPMVEQRRLKLLAEAEEAYRDGMVEYAEGVWEFRQGLEDARKELEDGYRKLIEGEQAILENEALIADGETQIAQAKSTLAQSESMLATSRQSLESMKALSTSQLRKNRDDLKEQVDTYQSEVDDLTVQISDKQGKLDLLSEQLGPAKTELDDVNRQLAELELSISTTDAAIGLYSSLLDPLQQDPERAAELAEKIESLQLERDTDMTQRESLKLRREELTMEMDQPLRDYYQLEADKRNLETKLTIRKISLKTAKVSLESAENAISAMDGKFAPMEEMIRNSEAQLASGKWQLAEKELELEAGKQALIDGREEIAQGWIDYNEGRESAQQELADAQKKLLDTKTELAEARETIDGMTDNTVFLMDRNSNIGYNSLDSASDIVQGVSRVFPAFFLLVAAMVCITTMTRMIDEERTQIGTLKALGYSSAAIISKYLLYAGSGAVVGCGLGVFIGSIYFPHTLWGAYKIMLYIPIDLVIRISLPLCSAVVGSYTFVMLGVTWYCCRRELEEVPAELIRPKAPEVGKKIFLERLPFWHKISFLNKVTIRNIFRYRQRLAMMMLGIGGCTALLVTGFGLRDSIVNVVDFQFEDITTYDMSVYFSEGQTLEQQTEFLEDIRGISDKAAFYHQSSVEIEYDRLVKEIYLIAGDERIQEFIDMHTGSESIPMPGVNELVLSVGTAEAMGIDVGDTVLMRNSDLQFLELKVSAIYDNYVYNYGIIHQQTIQAQWDEPAELQMAFVNAKDGHAIHEVSAEIVGMEGVMNVSVSDDLADMVANMMKALDMVIVVIVVCAGLLAAIVLYNLTNININERLREIATIKVLGFRASETAAYVFKENLSLTGLGSVFGLALGYLLLLFVMSQIKIDMVWFKTVILPPSYFWALALTMLSACLVDFIFYFRLEKINMAEALKSVE